MVKGWQGGMCGRGHMWWGGLWQGGVYGRGCAWQGVCTAGVCVWQEGMCDTEGGMCAGETATEGGGTHPTGMHSCSKGNYIEIIYINVNYNKFDLFAKLLVIIHEDT